MNSALAVVFSFFFPKNILYSLTELVSVVTIKNFTDEAMLMTDSVVVLEKV